jgi:hypothetical protein
MSSARTVVQKAGNPYPRKKCGIHKTGGCSLAISATSPFSRNPPIVISFVRSAQGREKS